MLREVIWSGRAVQEKIEILEYWKNRNKSNLYSVKLDQYFQEGIQLLTINPELGKPTNESFVRIKIVLDYLIYYRIKSDSIEILSIWDSRRNPQKFKL